MTWLWLAPVILAALVVAYVLGHRRGSAAWREEQRQRAIEQRLLGKEANQNLATGPPAVIKPARIQGTKSWGR